jgi:hypothetical protein
MVDVSEKFSLHPRVKKATLFLVFDICMHLEKLDKVKKNGAPKGENEIMCPAYSLK